jgi:hypothetical protein
MSADAGLKIDAFEPKNEFNIPEKIDIVINLEGKSLQ